MYNEADGIEAFHEALQKTLSVMGGTHEIIYVDDGSQDTTLPLLQRFAQGDSVRLLRLTRNFGKEIALSAGLREARGSAVLMLDADGQHPVERIPDFVALWRESGVKVVVGSRNSRNSGLVKRVGSKLFYGIFSKLTRIQLDPNAGDFRLIDRSVCDEFNQLTEHNRMTRSLIDWFGYPKRTIRYTEKKRQSGASPYSLPKLMKLAVDTAISHSTSPLYVAAYAGAAIMALATIVGLGMGINYLVDDPVGLHATASAYGLDLILFLVGLLLISQGIIGLYLSHIHAETQNRPLYVVDEKASKL